MQFLDGLFVFLGILFLQVGKESSSFADHHQKTATGMIVFIVRLQMIRQIMNPFGEQRDLHARRTRILRMHPKVINDFVLFVFQQRQFDIPPWDFSILLNKTTCQSPVIIPSVGISVKVQITAPVSKTAVKAPDTIQAHHDRLRAVT